jgi:hypothetical protein
MGHSGPNLLLLLTLPIHYQQLLLKELQQELRAATFQATQMAEQQAAEIKRQLDLCRNDNVQTHTMLAEIQEQV